MTSNSGHIVDRKARSALRDALISYMRGDIHTFAFDDRNSVFQEQAQTEDHGALEISRFLWTIHDDFIDHPISVTSEGWQVLKRVVAFLATDLELGPATESSSPFWPFRDASEWLANERFSRHCGLPDYDSQTHGRQIQEWYNRIPTAVGIGVIIGLLALAILGFCLCEVIRGRT